MVVRIRNPDSGTTDTISSLPIIACGVVSVMVLLEAMAIVSPSQVSEESLISHARYILDNALTRLTEQSEGGRRFLFNDFELRIKVLMFSLKIEDGISSSLEVRLLNELASTFKISGDVKLTNQRVTIGAPVLYMKGGAPYPAEIIVVVGT